MAMSEGWNNIYNSDNSFFGEEPSDFALLCLNQMMSLDVRSVLELGAGHGRDAIFFASNGLEVKALDYSDRGIEILNKKAQEKSCQINTKPFDIKQSLPFPNTSFDAVYSHMLLDMKFSKPELRLIFSEISRVLKPNGLNFFSVRNYRDRFYGKGIEAAGDCDILILDKTGTITEGSRSAVEYIPMEKYTEEDVGQVAYAGSI